MHPETLKVTKQQVEQITVQLDDTKTVLSLDSATLLWEELGAALGKPKVSYHGCGDRYAHGPHTEMADGAVVICRGRSFDAT